MKINATAFNISKAFQINNKVQLQKTNSTDQAVKKTQISTEERDFFLNLYPENKEEIMDYHHYLRSGKMSGVSLGSLFDRRG